jgi:hypothetical protein
MVFFVLVQLLSWLIDRGTLRLRLVRDMEQEILLLHRQFAILQYAQLWLPHLRRWEKLGLALQLFSPDTVLGWLAPPLHPSGPASRMHRHSHERAGPDGRSSYTT